jgi:hypothetical protein
MEFASPLSTAAWIALAGIPLGIIALYFLKLRRRPVQVPSTLLWRRSMEDLHVNSLFQRLRKNLLLFLQLLVILLAMLALAGPRIKGTVAQGQRFVVAIDISASMSATDVSPNRLANAKVEAKKIVDAMEADDSMMVIAFSDRARVISSYTSNRSLLRQRIDAIDGTQGTTSLRDALQVASGLANPASDKAARDLPQGVIATQQVSPILKIFTDGGFADVEGFSIGNLIPEVVVIGRPPPPLDVAADPTKQVKKKDPSNNVAVLALQIGRNDEKPDEYQVFGRVRNYRAKPVKTEAKLLRHAVTKPGGKGVLIDAVALNIDAQSEQAFKFDLRDTGAAELEVQINVDDALPIDDRAYAVFGNPRKAQVLLVTAGNRYLTDTLQTVTATQLADIETVSPDEFKDAETRRKVAAGRFDLLIFDHVQPEAPPEANTLYFGTMPPGKVYEKSRTIDAPVVLDWDQAHPLMQYIRDLALVRIAKATVVEPPAGASVLIEGNRGPLAFMVGRGGFVDTVVGFSLLDGKNFNTDWPLRYSFPLFLFNSLRVLGNARDSSGDTVNLPGQPIVLRADALTDSIKITSVDGRALETLKRTPQGTFVFNGATKTGIYHASWGKDGSLAIPVNLFDPRESDLATRGLVPEGATAAQAEQYQIKIGYNPVQGSRRSTPAVKDWWKPIAVAVLGLLLLEWYIYNRRVYI